MKKHIKKILIIVLVITAGFLGYKLVYNKPADLSKVKVQTKIKGYNYELTANKTSLYKSYFKQLNSILTKAEVDEEAYAKLVAKMFVADFYDLNSKISKNDIGGTVFIYPKALENFKLNANDTLYKYIDNKVIGKRTQELPIVKEVKIDNIESTQIQLNDEAIEGYKIKLHWLYKENLGYQTKADLELIKDDKYIYITKLD